MKVLLNYDQNANHNNVKHKFDREYNILKSERLPRHENIVTIYHALVENISTKNLPDWPAANDQRPSLTLCLIFPCFPERLSHAVTKLVKKPYFEEFTIKRWLRDLLSAINHLHKHKIVHRDIKPDNIYFTTDDLLKPVLCDFGESWDASSFVYEGSQSFVMPYPLDFISKGGNPSYFAPEIQTVQPGPKSTLNYTLTDEYALGKIFYELLSDGPIFEKSGQEGYMRLLEAVCSQELDEIIGGLLKWEVNERWTASTALERVEKIWNKVHQ